MCEHQLSKFDSCTDALMYDQMPSEEAGNSSDGPGWAGLILGPVAQDDVEIPTELDRDCIEWVMLNNMAGCIVEEDTNGSVQVDYHETVQGLLERWNDVRNLVEQY